MSLRSASLRVTFARRITIATLSDPPASRSQRSVSSYRAPVACIKTRFVRSSSFRLGWVSRGLVALEVAFSIALLIGAGLTVKSVVQLRNLDPGFVTSEIFTARLGLFDSDYPDDAGFTTLNVVSTAGAGIVADSLPERELDETRAKARGLLRALGSGA